MGRYPLYISRYVRIITYWTKVIQTENMIIKLLYDIMMQQMKKSVNYSASMVKYLLDLVFYVCNAQNSIHLGNFLNTFKKRLVDEFIQRWHVRFSNSM